MGKKNIVAITAGGPYPWAIINAVGDKYGPVTVVQEQPESMVHFLRRRARKVGYISVLGQFATMIVSRFGKKFARRRESEIINQFDLRVTPSPEHRIITVPSANSDACVAVVENEKPDVILLAGCRMLNRRTLAAISAPVINYHAGINPKYRGMMGGYWSRINNDEENYGTTVHFVDEGVDTGSIIYQTRIKPSPSDTIVTDAMAMAAHSREMCVRAIDDILNGQAKTLPTDLPTGQWFHPPIWSYLWNGLTRRVW